MRIYLVLAAQFESFRDPFIILLIASKVIQRVLAVLKPIRRRGFAGGVISSRIA